MCVTAEGMVREILEGGSYAAGKPVEEMFVIVDLKGFG